MSSNATLCLPKAGSNGNRPYWHVVLGIHNRGKAKIMLLSLSVTEKARGAGSGPANCPTLVSWKEGDLILGEEGAFAGYAVRIPFTGDLTSPAIAYEWNYR
ncbi:hypothetical protein CLOP_g24131 [Closterium sp. NIES-67]|nr:hypothetical protein CLOP_g24131 [Closterium sp. NIES-67]